LIGRGTRLTLAVASSTMGFTNIPSLGEYAKKVLKILSGDNMIFIFDSLGKIDEMKGSFFDDDIKMAIIFHKKYGITNVMVLVRNFCLYTL
jgi:hypothetical protein